MTAPTDGPPDAPERNLTLEALALYHRGGVAAVQAEFPGLVAVPEFRESLKALAHPDVRLWTLPEETLEWIREARRFAADAQETLVLDPEHGEPFMALFGPLVGGSRISVFRLRLYADHHPEILTPAALDAARHVRDLARAQGSASAPWITALTDALQELLEHPLRDTGPAQVLREAPDTLRELVLRLIAHLVREHDLPPETLVEGLLTLLEASADGSTGDLAREVLTEVAPAELPPDWVRHNLVRLDHAVEELLTREEEVARDTAREILRQRTILAARLCERGTRDGDPAAVNAGIALSRRCTDLAVALADPAFLLDARSMYVSACLDGHRVTDDVRYLQEGIAQEEYFRGPDGEDGAVHASGLHNVGSALMRLFERTGLGTFLDRAFAAHEASVGATPADHPSRALRLNSLGWSLLARYGISQVSGAAFTDARPLLDRAISCFEQAIELLPERSLRAAIYTNYGQALSMRSGSARDPADGSDDLDAVVGLFERARTLVDGDLSRRARYSMNCGQAYFRRAHSGDDPPSAATAETWFRQAMAESPEGSQVHEWSHLSLQLCVRWARRPPSAGPGPGPAVLGPTMSRGLDHGLNLQVGETALTWMEAAERDGAWREAAEAADWAIQAFVSAGRSQSADRVDDRNLDTISRAASRGCAALVRAGEHAAAALAAERVRSVQLSSRLAADERLTEKLRVEHPPLHDRYLAVRSAQAADGELAAPPPSGGSGLLENHRAETALGQVLREIRRNPGFEGFGAGPAFQDLVPLAGPDPLVFLVPAVDDVVAVIVTGDGGSSSLRLPGATEGELLQLSAVYLTAEVHRDDDWPGYLAAMTAITNWLGEFVARPVAEALPSGATGLCVVPCGFFSFLPLHAAWHVDPGAPDGKRYLLEDYTVRYLPSAKIGLTVTGGPTDPARRDVLIVDNPGPGAGSYLRGAAREAENIERLGVPCRRLSGARATVDEVAKELPNAKVVHFSTHGVVDVADPMNSGVLLSRGRRLTPPILAGLDNLPHLAVLSACDSGFGGMAAPNEAIGLPASFLAGGTQAVVGSLWPVSDQATSAVMWLLYELLAGGLTVSRALQGAQLALRRATLPDGLRTVDPVLAALVQTGQLVHPYYWAGFCVTGLDVRPWDGRS